MHANGTDICAAGAPKGLFATLLSPCAFGAMPHTLASVDHSPVFHPKMLSPLQ
jgi:hypothetical protein